MGLGWSWLAPGLLPPEISRQVLPADSELGANSQGLQLPAVDRPADHLVMDPQEIGHFLNREDGRDGGRLPGLVDPANEIFYVLLRSVHF